MSEPGTTPHQYLCPGGSRRSQSHPSSAFLQVQEEALQGLRFAKQSSLASQSKPVDSVAELLRQCVSAFAEKSQDRDAWYGFASDGLELPNRRSQRKLFTAHDTVTYRRKSDRVSSEELKRISAAGFCTFIPDTSVPTGPEHEVSLRWLKASPCTENVAPENDITRIGLQRESLKAWPMVCFEGASRGPAHRTVKGWEIIKAGMEHVLGRSIVPATKHTLSDASPSTGKTLQHRRDKLKSRDGLDRRDNLALSSANQGNTCITNSGPPTQPAQGLASAKGGAKASLLSQRNAFAGAFAGTCVSLCLHPIDTVKTVIQAQSFGQRSALHTLFTIIADRGFLGLYRGLGSNLASSAPISAIYTFTYESVKAALLPHLPKEYHAIAHCTAGGCASIATSIVYTPSECVKQRMQVGSLYRNSWLAFLGILKNGGLSVLYSGWGAVLCRNVPQSVIKFYTYEGLKHYALGRHPDGIPLSTWQTLAFGGMAGSTAALFTTPFDVIKTRLQTQVPGSIMYHKGVFQAFQHIATSEGLGGLYRGLIPRLVIYVSQGALFFASYEFFKQLLAMEVKKISLRSSHSPDMVGQGNVVESS